MRTRTRRIGLILLTAVIGVTGVGGVLPAWGADTAPATTSTSPAQPVMTGPAAQRLAESLVALAQSRGRAEGSVDAGVSPQVVQQSISLLKMALQINPTEKRYLRLLADGQAMAGQTEDQVQTLKELLKLDASNTTVWCELIDLYLSKMQSADARGNYLDGLLATKGMDPEVISFVAYRRAQLYRELLQEEKARAMVALSIANNPVDPDATWLNWQLIASDKASTKHDRLIALLASVKASPARVEGLSSLAATLAEAGLYEDSVAWYSATLRLVQPTPPELAQSCALAMVLANKPFEASQVVDALLKEHATQSELQFINLLVSQQPVTGRDFAKTKTDAKATFEANLARALDPTIKADATDVKLPRLGDQAARIKALAPEKQDEVRLALSDLGWYLLYYEGPSAEATEAINLLKALAPADDVTVARLEGWDFLLQGKKPEATVKLQAVADRDPLAALGLLRMLDKSTVQANQLFVSKAHDLLRANPDGLVGAIIATELLPQGVAYVLEEEFDPLRSDIRQFTTTWQNLLANPGQYFIVRGEPLKVAHDEGDPMLAVIAFQNRSEFDLSIGEHGVIHPGLWFDARISGLMGNQTLAGCAFEQIRQRRVLKANSTVSQVVRLDAYSLDPLFSSNPAISFDVTFFITTNPLPAQDDKGNPIVSPGAAGMKQTFSRLMQRVPMNLSQPGTINAVMNGLVNGDETERYRRMELLATYIQVLNTQIAKSETPDPKMVSVVRDYASRIGQRRFDNVPAVAAWSSYELAISLKDSPDNLNEIIRQMRVHANPVQRLLAVDAAAKALDAKNAITAVGLQTNDPDPTVAAFAAATLDLLQHPTTKPAEATQPAAGNSAAPAGSTPAGAGSPSAAPTGAFNLGNK